MNLDNLFPGIGGGAAPPPQAPVSGTGGGFVLGGWGWLWIAIIFALFWFNRGVLGFGGSGGPGGGYGGYSGYR